MQPVLGAMAELARLCSVTVVCVCLRLVLEEASNQEAGSTPLGQVPSAHYEILLPHSAHSIPPEGH
jgi:hypothetical protein